MDKIMYVVKEVLVKCPAVAREGCTLICRT